MNNPQRLHLELVNTFRITVNVTEEGVIVDLQKWDGTIIETMTAEHCEL